MNTPPSSGPVFGAHLDYSYLTPLIPEAVLEAAVEKQRAGEVRLLTFTGKMGAGKDTVGRAVAETLMGDAHQASFATSLRVETQTMIDLIAQHPSRPHQEHAEAILRHFEQVGDPVTPTAVLSILEQLTPAIAERKNVSAYDRFPAMRKALQYWGTDVRRTTHEDYWVEKLIVEIVESLANGTSIYVTDARFINEVIAIQRIGGYAVRLTVSPEVQNERLIARDGRAPSEEALSHPSETALDTFTDFDLVIDTDHHDVPAITALVDEALFSR